jgi:hypothetical protein
MQISTCFETGQILSLTEWNLNQLYHLRTENHPQSVEFMLKGMDLFSD